jgi:signal transduction histidine kinase
MHSLRLRIVLAIALVCAATLAGVASFVMGSTLLIHIGGPPESAAGIGAALAPAVQAGATPAALRAQLARLGAKYGVRVVLVNTATRVALASFGPVDAVAVRADGNVVLSGRSPGATQSSTVVLRGGLPVGATPWRLFVLPNGQDADALAPVRGSIQHSIWQSAALGIVAAVIVAILLGGYIVKPIRELTAATQAMSGGDTARRVRIRTHDEIGQLGDSFNRMADAIETTERLRRQMITDVAHELRTPLTRIVVQLEGMEDGHVAAEEAIAGVRDDVARLGHIVDDLRDLSLADARELAISREALALDHCIAGAVDRMQKNAGNARIALTQRAAPNPALVLGDTMRVAQILDNLIANALQYTPAGGSVEVGAMESGDFVECFVQDSGPGIAPEQLPFIFERFYRADGSRNRATGGSGLGLAIVKSLVEAQGGSVRAESVPGHGARFTWTLPRFLTERRPEI